MWVEKRRSTIPNLCEVLEWKEQVHYFNKKKWCIVIIISSITINCTTDQPMTRATNLGNNMMMTKMLLNLPPLQSPQHRCRSLEPTTTMCLTLCVSLSPERQNQAKMNLYICCSSMDGEKQPQHQQQRRQLYLVLIKQKHHVQITSSQCKPIVQPPFSVVLFIALIVWIGSKMMTLYHCWFIAVVVVDDITCWCFCIFLQVIGVAFIEEVSIVTGGANKELLLQTIQRSFSHTYIVIIERRMFNCFLKIWKLLLEYVQIVLIHEF